ncbi:hypothetical protein ISN76_20285 [Dyella halodurans]|uniref:Integron Cassette Protein Hfx-Cass5 domain-containing protein n=1 Tax=Dyella halodurans TaxID=1920171 RepID=A0ABV9C806_9GAMM
MQDGIAKIEIDADGRLHVVPASCNFPLIYREAMDVHWDGERRSLHSPQPREWPYFRWLQQIIAAAREQGVSLHLSESTEWLNIEPRVVAELRRAVE